MPFGRVSNNIREKLRGQGSIHIFSRRMAIMAVLAMLSLISIFVFIRYSTEQMRESVRSSLEQSVEQRRLNIDFRLRSVMQADQNLISLIYPYMDTDSSTEQQFSEYEELVNAISAHTDIAFISNVRLYVPDNKVYSHLGNTFYGLSSLTEEDRETLEPGTQWLETHAITLRSTPGDIPETKYMLTCAHLLRQRMDYSKTACALMLDVEVSLFDELLSTESASAEEQTGYLINSHGLCLAAVDKTELGQYTVPDQVMSTMRETVNGCLEYAGQVYVYHKLETTDWYVVMRYPNTVLFLRNTSQAGFMQAMILVLLLIATLMVFVLAYNFTLNITLSRINASMNAMIQGKPQEHQSSAIFPDLLKNLESNADQMVLAMQELLENRYKDQLAIADSQMKSLQAQIKPHFLYNTLDIVKWMILDSRTDEAVWMINSLSKYLRMSINKGPAIIPLEEELELSRIYLSIMQKRFENRFSASYEIEESALQCRIPKLSIQPLLENALLHGVLYSEKPEKELTIRAWEADGYLHIEVEDNGNGMDAQTCQDLETGRLGYGFGNVKKRLSLFGKEQSQCSIFSMMGVGTCVSIHIPAITEGDSFGEGLGGTE